MAPPGSGAISLATRHGKERAIARPFARHLGLTTVVAEGFDTDSLGTFSGEVPRPAGPEHTCRLKAEQGMRFTGLECGVASEGSFGPHPLVPLLPVGREWMTYIDRSQNLVIVERLLAHRTNFSHRLVAAGTGGSEGERELTTWLAQVGFPSHGLIVRPHQAVGEVTATVRGIRCRAALAAALQQAGRASSDGRALVETDMRAHMNPTRMASIRRLAFRLVRRIATPCPACGSPGWGEVDLLTGLPCGDCGAATSLLHWHVDGCVRCSHRQRRPRSDGRTVADPGHCPFCNP